MKLDESPRSDNVEDQRGSGIGRGAGIGIGNVFSSLISAVARNPAAQAQVQPFAFLGFALAEATGLFGLAIAFLILFVF